MAGMTNRVENHLWLIRIVAEEEFKYKSINLQQIQRALWAKKAKKKNLRHNNDDTFHELCISFTPKSFITLFSPNYD